MRRVETLKGHTESDPLGILAQTLVMFGNMIGPEPHFVVENTKHYANQNILLVGRTSQGRKGTSSNRAKESFETADPDWIRWRIIKGLSSGEGLIAAVRDATYEKHPIRAKGRVVDYQDVMTDAGVEDKRALILETEFGGVLRALEREGNKLSSLIRGAWDHEDLGTLTKKPLRATNPHISIVGHITAEELTGFLSQVDIANGFANRFMFFAVRRNGRLPFGGGCVNISSIKKKMPDAGTKAKRVGLVTLTDNARALWEANYDRLTGDRPGTFGAVTSRAAPHVLRMAMLYALMDGHSQTDSVHLGPALKLWDASDACAAYIFGDSTGNPDADRVPSAIKARPDGLTRKEISIEVFQRHKSKDAIDKALALLIRGNFIVETRFDTGGQPAHRYYPGN